MFDWLDGLMALFSAGGDAASTAPAVPDFAWDLMTLAPESAPLDDLTLTAPGAADFFNSPDIGLIAAGGSPAPDLASDFLNSPDSGLIAAGAVPSSTPPTPAITTASVQGGSVGSGGGLSDLLRGALGNRGGSVNIAAPRFDTPNAAAVPMYQGPGATPVPPQLPPTPPVKFTPMTSDVMPQRGAEALSAPARAMGSPFADTNRRLAQDRLRGLLAAFGDMA